MCWTQGSALLPCAGEQAEQCKGQLEREASVEMDFREVNGYLRVYSNARGGPCSKQQWKKSEFSALFRQKQEDRCGPERQFLVQIKLKMMLRLHT